MNYFPLPLRFFLQTLLASYKRNKNINNFSSTLKSNDQPDTFKCARIRYMTCPFMISNVNKISEPKQTVIITDQFPLNLFYCIIFIYITSTLCRKIYIEKLTGRRLKDRFREHLRDFEINDEDASKPITRRFNLPNYSHKHMAVCGLSLSLSGKY